MGDMRQEVTHDGRLVKRLIKAWHSSLKPPAGWRVAFLLYDGDPIMGKIVGVSTWGRPVAPREDQVTTLEHTRMALSPQAPKNAASWFIARNRSWIRENLAITRIISYVDDTLHTGVTYRADNWVKVYSAMPKRSSWSNRTGHAGKSAVSRTKFERRP